MNKEISPNPFFITYMIICINNQLNIFIMKKVILSISAMLFVGAASYAQPGPSAGANSSLVGQLGTSQNALVHQIGTAQSSKIKQTVNNNDAFVYQGVNPGQIMGSGVNISTKNMADIDQKGNDNRAFISQNNWDNKATQKQVGDRNDATIWQDETGFSYPALKGHDTATQTQTGKDNKATIDQGTSGNNPLPVVGTFPMMNPLSSAVPVNPHGDNVAVQTQTGNFNLAYTSQGGLRNDSKISQNSTSQAASASARNEANHYQYGNDNIAETTQLGFKNRDNILQEGNWNKSYTNQNGFSSGNMNAVSQQGSYNVSNVTQSN